jgi:hypothetical protein
MLILLLLNFRVARAIMPERTLTEQSSSNVGCAAELLAIGVSHSTLEGTDSRPKTGRVSPPGNGKWQVVPDRELFSDYLFFTRSHDDEDLDQFRGVLPQ